MPSQPRPPLSVFSTPMKKKSKFFECSCSGHALSVIKFEEEEQCYLSIWLRGYQKPYWKYRLRQIWHIIRTGQPYEDEVILTREASLELSIFLKKMYDRK